MTGKYRLPMLIGAVIVIGDQVCKWAVETYMPFQVKYEMVPTLALFRTYNEGIAFSLLSGLGAMPLVAIALAVSAFVIWLWIDSPIERHLSHYGFALILGGAIGNLIDRVRLGYVIDYFLFHLPQWSFAVFNFADAAITVGAGLVILDEVLAWRRHARHNNDSEQN